MSSTIIIVAGGRWWFVSCGAASDALDITAKHLFHLYTGNFVNYACSPTSPKPPPLHRSTPLQYPKRDYNSVSHEIEMGEGGGVAIGPKQELCEQLGGQGS